MSGKIRRVFIFPDTHVPYHDETAISVVEKFMADIWIDEYVHLGDLMDFDMISSFNADNLRENETRRLAEDYRLANQILDRHQAIVRKRNKKAKFTLLEGNHEERIQKLINKNPELEGLLEVPKNLRLEERGFKWVPNYSTGELHKIGRLYFSHGKYINKYHPAKMVDTYGVNLAYGHAHDMMSHTKMLWGKNKIIMAQSLGFLADEKKLKYMKDGPSNWLQGFGVAEIREDGNFNLFPVAMIDYTFSWNGKIYEP